MTTIHHNLQLTRLSSNLKTNKKVTVTISWGIISNISSSFLWKISRKSFRIFRRVSGHGQLEFLLSKVFQKRIVYR